MYYIKSYKYVFSFFLSFSKHSLLNILTYAYMIDACIKQAKSNEYTYVCVHPLRRNQTVGNVITCRAKPSIDPTPQIDEYYMYS